MDPSAILCRYKSSFDNQGEIPIVLHTYVTTEQETGTIVKDNLILSGAKKFGPRHENKGNYCDPSLYQEVKDHNNNNNNKLYDPFRDISYKPFLNHDSIVLADIDMTFNFSNHTSGYIVKQESVKDYNFATINDGPGGFSQYVMYRNPSSYGYGITPKEHPFDTGRIDMTHFNIIKGPSGNGDIARDYKGFIKNIRTVEASGLDLVLGNYINDTDISSEGYILRLIVALGVVKIGGTFISKVSDLSDPFMIDLLYITSQAFDKITLFKPLSIDITNNVYYIVAEDAKINNIDWVSYLEESYTSSVKNDKDILRLVDQVPNSLLRWITDYNNLILLYKKYLQDLEKSGISELYDTYKCKAIWNLPQI